MKNGERHTLHCQCTACADQRFGAFVDRMKSFVKETGARPSNVNQTVMVRSFTVRAHWRRNPYHFNSDEALKERVDGYFKRFNGKARP